MKRQSHSQVLAFLIMLISFGTSAQNLSNRIILSARLQGINEIPSVTTNANGVASFLLNATRDTMQVNIAFTGMKASAMHIHEGKPNTNGTVVKDLTQFISGNIARFTLTGADLSPSNLRKYFSGDFYINIHSTNFPNGEIRGQITVETDQGYFVEMNGANSVPSVNTTAKGAGVFVLDKSGTRITFKVAAQGVSGKLTGSHFHTGAAGQVGNGILSDASNLVNGMVTEGAASVSNSFAVQANNGEIYYNYHTLANQAGEIRGQLIPLSGFVFESMLNSKQIGNPNVTSDGQAVAWLTLNYDMDTLSYHVAAFNLSSKIVASHIHLGNLGTNGGVVFDLGTGADNVIKGNITGKDLTNEVISRLFSGTYYINIHTENNPTTGEVRGQINKLAREGYIMNIDAAQEVPSVASNAKGGGLVTINYFETSAHYMIAVDGLSGEITSAHFHKAIKGQNGNVLLNLSKSTGLYGYWASGSNPKFNAAHSRAFLGDSIYVNFHTADFPNGEVRGQVIKNYKVSSFTSTKESIGLKNDNFSVFPNPIENSVLNLEVDFEKNITVDIVIYDTFGRVVFLQKKQFLQGKQSEILDISALGSGIYLIGLKNEGNLSDLKKLIKM